MYDFVNSFTAGNSHLAMAGNRGMKKERKDSFGIKGILFLLGGGSKLKEYEKGFLPKRKE